MIFNLNYNIMPTYKQLDMTSGNIWNHRLIGSVSGEGDSVFFYTNRTGGTLNAGPLDATFEIDAWEDSCTLYDVTEVPSLEHYYYIFKGLDQPTRVQCEIDTESWNLVPVPSLPSGTRRADLYGLIVDRPSAGVKVPEIGNYNSMTLYYYSGTMVNNRTKVNLPATSKNYINYTDVMTSHSIHTDGYDIYTPTTTGKYLVYWVSSNIEPIERYVLNQNTLIRSHSSSEDTWETYVVQRIS